MTAGVTEAVSPAPLTGRARKLTAPRDLQVSGEMFVQLRGATAQCVMVLCCAMPAADDLVPCVPKWL